MAIRSAYAMMVNQTNNGYFTGMTGNPPLVTPLSAQAWGTAASNIKLDNAIGGAGGVALNPAFTDPNFQPARMQSWNANVEREIGTMGLMVGYFGSHGDRLPIPINLNQFTVPGGTVRPYPRVSLSSPITPGAVLNNIAERVSTGWSNYNALWVTVNRRLSKGLQVSGSYTLSKSKDTNSGDGTMSEQDSFNLADSYALSDFDVVIECRSTRRTTCRSRATVLSRDGRSSSSSKRRPAVRTTSRRALRRSPGRRRCVRI